MVENAVIFTPGAIIGAEHLEGYDLAPTSTASAPPPVRIPSGVFSPGDLRETYLKVLEQTGWNISRVAHKLGITRNTLRARIARWNLRELAAQRGSGQAGATRDLPETGLPDTDRVFPADSGRLGEREHAGDDNAEPAAEAGPDTRVVAREIRWERRWLGFLRFGLVLSDADDAMVRARQYLDLALEKVRQFGGQLVELWPTGFDAAFGFDAIEGAAQRAGSAALAIQVAAGRAHQDSTGTPAWGVVLHAMSCLVGSHGLVPRIDRDARRRASEVLDALALECQLGSVLASGEISAFLRRRFNLGARTASRTAGGARPVLGPLLQPGGFGERPGTFVGRRSEIEMLEARGAMARQGRGQIVGIVGDPGVGKSRLVWEFTHGGPDRGWLVLESSSVALGHPTPFFGMIDLLRAYFDVVPGEPEDAVRDKIARRLTSLDEALMSLLPAFLSLFDLAVDDAEWRALEPPQRRRQILTAIKRLLLEESDRQPLMLVSEDAHWADAETRELLDEMADSVPVAPVLMLVTYRPEHEHTWGGRSFYTQLRVEPLRGESADRLLDELLGVDPSLGVLRRRLIQSTDGNPFFVEEVVRTLAESGALKGDRGAYRLAHAVNAIVVPGTVEEVLASRIDRLGPGPAELLRAAAVVGRQVSYAALAAVSRERPETVEQHLRALQSGEFLYRAGEGDEREYTFRHGLTQEVAYASLTDDERCSLHSRALEAMLRVYKVREDEKLDELAHHAFAGRVWNRAAGYLRRAGRRAFARSANSEAIECFTRALTALSHLPPSREYQVDAFDLRFDMRAALWPLGEISRMDTILSEAGDLAQALQDPRRQGLVAVARCHYFFLMSRHADAMAAGDAALALARATGNAALERDATLYVGIVHGAIGSYRQAVELLQAALDSFAAAHGKLSARERVVGLPTARTYIARYLAELGELSRAAEHGGAGMKTIESGGGPWFQTTCYSGMGNVELRRGDFEAAAALFERALELCHTHQLDSLLPSVGASLGYALANAGRLTEGRNLREQATAQAERIHLRASSSMWLTYLAEAYLRLGQIQEARSAAITAQERARKQGERGHEAWALFMLATIAESTGSSGLEELETAFDEARQLAGTLGMRPLLALCHARLGEAYDHRGRADRTAQQRAQAEAICAEIGMILPTTTSATASPSPS
jgi:tetratricopeptide (TPR) repeat protein